jgi:hypothetical protein
MSATFAYDDAGAKHNAVDIKAYPLDGTARKDVSVGYAYTTDGRRKVVYARTQPVLSLSFPHWDAARLSWSAPSYPVSRYVLKLGTTVLYDGIATGPFEYTWSTVALVPNTAYIFTLETYYSDNVGNVLESTVTATGSTPAWVWSTPLYKSDHNQNAVRMNWGAADPRSVTAYDLYRNMGGWSHIYSGTGGTHVDGGLPVNDAHSYHLYARRGSTDIGFDSEDAAPRQISWTGWATTTYVTTTWLTWATSTWEIIENNDHNWGGTQQYAYRLRVKAAGSGVAMTAEPRINGHQGPSKPLENKASRAMDKDYWSPWILNNEDASARPSGDASYPMAVNAISLIGIKRPKGKEIQWRIPSDPRDNDIHFHIYYWWFTQAGERNVYEEIRVNPDDKEIMSKWVWDAETDELIESFGPDPRIEPALVELGSGPAAGELAEEPAPAKTRSKRQQKPKEPE